MNKFDFGFWSKVLKVWMFPTLWDGKIWHFYLTWEMLYNGPENPFYMPDGGRRGRAIVY